MALADRIHEAPDTIHGHPCSVGKLIDELPPSELAAFQLIMYGRAGLTKPRRGIKGWTEAEIFEVIQAEGYKVAKSQINTHRGGKCRCYK